MSVELRTRIETALQDCARSDLATGARSLLQTLGYRSDRTVDLASSDAAGFAELLRDIGREDDVQPGARPRTGLALR